MPAMDTEQYQQKQFRRRLALLGIVTLIGFIALAARLTWLQALQ
jgi:hypothetical protein